MGQAQSHFSANSPPSSGDARVRVQEWISTYETRVRRRVLGKFHAISSGPFDIDDVMSSVRRRLDLAVSEGKVDVNSLVEFQAYLYRVAHNVAYNALRSERRHNRLLRMMAVHREAGQDEYAAALKSTLAFDEIGSAMKAVGDYERRALQLWAIGHPHSRIAATLGLKFEQHRSRWRRLWRRLQTAERAASRK